MIMIISDHPRPGAGACRRRSPGQTGQPGADSVPQAPRRRKSRHDDPSHESLTESESPPPPPGHESRRISASILPLPRPARRAPGPDAPSQSMARRHNSVGVRVPAHWQARPGPLAGPGFRLSHRDRRLSVSGPAVLVTPPRPDSESAPGPARSESGRRAGGGCSAAGPAEPRAGPATRPGP